MTAKIATNSAAEIVNEIGGEEAFFRWINVPTHLRIAESFEELQLQVGEGLPVKVLFVTGRNSGSFLGYELAASLGMKEPIVVSDNTFDNVEKLASEATRSGARMLVGVGGGKVVDVCKYAAHLLKLPFYSIPTQI